MGSRQVTEDTGIVLW